MLANKGSKCDGGVNLITQTTDCDKWIVDVHRLEHDGLEALLLTNPMHVEHNCDWVVTFVTFLARRKM